MANAKTATNTFGGTLTAIATFASPVTAGGVVWVCVMCTDGSTIGTPTDTALNSYTALDTNNNGIIHTKAFYAKNIAAGVGNLAVTVVLSGGTGEYGFVVAHELTGRDTTAPLGASVAAYQTGIGTGTDAITTAAVASGDGYDVVGCTGDAGGFDQPTVNPGTNFASVAGTSGETPNDSFSKKGRSESLTQSGAGTKAATFTTITAALDWITHVATFKAASAAGRTTHNTRSFPLADTLGTSLGMTQV